VQAIKKVESRIRETLRKIREERGRGRNIGRGWWDEEYVEKKKIVRTLRKWRKGRREE